MRIIIKTVLLNIICFNISSQSLISDTNIIENLFLVTKNDGGEYIGEIISDDGREILMVTKSIGKLFINKSGRLITERPEFFISLATMIIGLQFFLAGFLGELILRTRKNKDNYIISEKTNSK